MKDTFTGMIGKGYFEEMLERKIVLWTNSSSFMDTFTSLALIFPRFVPPGANFIFENIRIKLKRSNKRWR